MRTPYPWLRPSRDLLETACMWAFMSLAGLLFMQVVLAFLLDDVTWWLP